MTVTSVTTLATAGWLDTIARSLRAGFFMFWVTLWPLILGFTLSGAVQSFGTRTAMQRLLGNHRPAAVARASGYGMVSSSCSYAASALGKSLFAKGADFVAAMVFMFASTNLVIELGIVLVVLMGWQFAASEYVGGTIMIVLLAAAGGLWFRGRTVIEAQQRLAADGGAAEHHHAAPDSDNAPLRTRLRSREGWSDAAAYTMADVTMLRRELAIGYVVAGFLAVVVPVSVWHAVFLVGHGPVTNLQNAIVGPFIAIISFVCSIGNVPLAAALWKGGISFGGVVAFIFADLITFPLLLIYRRYYGTRLMLRMLVVFWGVMSVAGLLTGALFEALHLVPTTRPTVIAPDQFSWDYTTFLNIVFLALFALVWRAARRRSHAARADGPATDPVCGMQVEVAHAPASATLGEERYYFCSDSCRDRFERDAVTGGRGAGGRAAPGAM